MPLRRRLVISALVLTAITIATAVCYGAMGAIVRRQVVALPTPDGPHPVGRTAYQWTDPSRPDPLAPTPGRPRRLAIWVWYPAADTAGRSAAPYLPGAWYGMRSGGLWSYLAQDPRRIRDHAVADAPPVPGPSRVLVMEPGLGLAAPDFATVAEGLASHGYVVVGVTPTYSANNTVLDGRLTAATSAGKNYGDDLARVWADDSRFALDRIAHEPRFAGVLDTVHAGFFGHSFGGASAAEACRLDARCVGAADVDGTPFGDVVRTGLDRPYLLIGGATTCTSPGCANDPAMHTMLAGARPAGTAYTISGALHFNFTDLALYHFTPPLRRVLPVGPIEPATALRIETSLLEAFFDAAYGDPSTIDRVAAGYPQVRRVPPAT